MANILFITREVKRKEFLSQLLGPEYFIIPADGDQGKIDSLLPAVDLVVVDFSSLAWESLDIISRVKELKQSAVILGLGRGIKKDVVQAARERGLTEYIDVDGDISLVPQFIREKMEKKMLTSRMQEEKVSTRRVPFSFPLKKERNFFVEEWQFFEEMSRFLIHGYNLDELLQFFLGLLSRRFGITRLCLLLKDKVKGNYRIRACLGLQEEIKEYVELDPRRGLANFLTTKGTVVTRESVLQADLKTAYQIKQEMKLIQSNVVVPLFPQGELIGILGLGPKITGEDMSLREIQQVFLFSNQVGLAIQNLLFYEQMGYQKKYIENVLENASSGVISVNIDKKITTCNPRAQKILNLESQNLIGKDIRTLPSPLGDLLYETLTQGTPHSRKEVYISGIKRWMGISATQMRDTEGKVIGAMMIFTDLTPIKHLQEEKKKAQKRDFLAQVAARLSHELRNSFVPIKSLAELLPSRYLDEEFQKRFFSVVTGEIERIDDLIERLLFFSQPLQLDKVAVSPFILIREAWDMVKEKIPQDKKVKFNTIPAGEDLLVYVDKKAMIEAFSHILNNCIEVAPQGKELMIEVCCQEVKTLPEFLIGEAGDKKVSPAPAGYVKIEFKDNGPGLTEKDKNRIFDPFFTTKNRGIGLGLTISQSIIEEHGGIIFPVSEQGEGTSMVIYLTRYQLPE